MSVTSKIMRIAQHLYSPAYTLYLFTESDTPLVIVPMVRPTPSLFGTVLAPHLSQLTVAMVLAGPTDWSSFLMALVWLELHLLAFDASAHSSWL